MDGELLAQARDQVRYWVEAGVTHVALPAEDARPVPAPVAKPAAPVAAQAVPEDAPQAGSRATRAASPAPPAPPAPATPADRLAVIQAELDGCTRCALANGRTHLVFGVGNPGADIVFVGEAPGRDEDQQGIPFVGRAGQLLTDIIEKGMGIPRASVYICNTVKCRPPDNRNPLPEELARCEPFLVRQLLTIRPKVIVAMGKFAAQALCRSDAPISRLRGNWHKYEDIDVMPTFHPAYLLRNPGAKREVWDDIRQVMARVGLPVKARP